MVKITCNDEPIVDGAGAPLTFKDETEALAYVRKNITPAAAKALRGARSAEDKAKAIETIAIEPA